jgi:hypothetical protein
MLRILSNLLMYSSYLPSNILNSIDTVSSFPNIIAEKKIEKLSFPLVCYSEILQMRRYKGMPLVSPYQKTSLFVLYPFAPPISQ